MHSLYYYSTFVGTFQITIRIMKTIRRLLFVMAVLSGLSSCNSDGKYVVADGKVYHSYWTFSFGYIYNELPQVDAASFESVKDWLGHDAHHAYFKERLIVGADVATLKARKYPLCSDKNDYYYKGVPLKVADVESFKILKWNVDDLWAKDSRYAYYDTIKIVTPDLASFRVKTWNTAVDSRYVYRYGKILPLADPETYIEEWQGLYSRDKSHIWCMGDLLRDADIETFTLEDWRGRYARDKSHIWFYGELVRDADYETFTVDKDGYASDKYGQFDGEKRITNEEQTEEPEPVEPGIE